LKQPILTSWYVITGGPSSGKSKLIDRLAFSIFQVIPEAARIYIDEEMSKGRKIEEIRADEAEFQRIVLKMKAKLELKVIPGRITFFERGIPDSVAYYRSLGLDTTPVIEASKQRRYCGIFLLDLLPYIPDYARTEDKETRRKLDQFLYEDYTNLGYNVIRVPVMTIGERMQFILERVKC